MENTNGRKKPYQPPTPAYVLSVIDEKGYVSPEELMQLTESGVPVYPRLADELGITPAEVKGLAERRELSVEAVRAVVQAAGA